MVSSVCRFPESAAFFFFFSASTLELLVLALLETPLDNDTNVLFKARRSTAFSDSIFVDSVELCLEVLVVVAGFASDDF